MKPSDSNLLHRGEFLELRRRRHWEYVRRTRSNGGAAFMIALTDEAELVLVEQLRLPVEQPVIELPAGIIGDHHPDESPEDAALRELEEETGFRAARVRRIFDSPTVAGISSEWAYYLRMEGLTRVGDGGGVGEEDIITHCVPLASAPQWLERQRAGGSLVDIRIYAALFWLAQAP